MTNFKYLNKSFDKVDIKWRQLFTTHFLHQLSDIDIKLEHIAQDNTIYPKQEDIFNAFTLTPWEQLSVVILGQDPYHGINEANGLAFSVNDGIILPPSLKNIFKELANEYGVDSSNYDGELLFEWANQGVLLLNSSLTVLKDKPNSLANIGWEIFTDSIISLISEEKENIVFILWGAFAGKKAKYIDKNKHLILTSAHPSPLSAYRGFLGCGHFIKTNQYLQRYDKAIINWC